MRIEAVGSALRGRPSWDQWEDLTTMAMRDAAAHLWSRSDLTPADVDVAQLYDGFSFVTLAWLEALGFCARGEGGPFLGRAGRVRCVSAEHRGGQLSAGRLHGFGLLHEACLQLRGAAGRASGAGGRSGGRRGRRRPAGGVPAAHSLSPNVQVTGPRRRTLSVQGTLHPPPSGCSAHG